MKVCVHHAGHAGCVVRPRADDAGHALAVIGIATVGVIGEVATVVVNQADAISPVKILMVGKTTIHDHDLQFFVHQRALPRLLDAGGTGVLLDAAPPVLVTDPRVIGPGGVALGITLGTDRSAGWRTGGFGVRRGDHSIPFHGLDAGDQL